MLISKQKMRNYCTFHFAFGCMVIQTTHTTSHISQNTGSRTYSHANFRFLNAAELTNVAPAFLFISWRTRSCMLNLFSGSATFLSGESHLATTLSWAVIVSFYSLKFTLHFMWSETPAHGFYAKIHVSMYAAGGQLTPNPWGYPRS